MCCVIWSVCDSWLSVYCVILWRLDYDNSCLAGLNSSGLGSRPMSCSLRTCKKDIRNHISVLGRKVLLCNPDLQRLFPAPAEDVRPAPNVRHREAVIARSRIVFSDMPLVVLWLFRYRAPLKTCTIKSVLAPKGTFPTTPSSLTLLNLCLSSFEAFLKLFWSLLETL